MMKHSNKLYAGVERAREPGEPLRKIIPAEDPLTWCAMYQDGTTIWEINNDGDIIYTYRDIVRQALKEFCIYITSDVLRFHHLNKIQQSNNSFPHPIMVIGIDPGKRLIWRKRRRLVIEGARKLPDIFVAGWMMDIDVISNGSKVRKEIWAINYLLPNGTVLLADKGDIKLSEWECPT